MHKPIQLLLAMMLLFANPQNMLAQVDSNTSVPVKHSSQLAWAHYISWGYHFDNEFDQPNTFRQLYDRTALGQWVGTDTGNQSNTRNQIRSAIQYGLNGFCVDYIKTKSYTRGMKRLYQASEGLPFHIALCIDGWNEPTEQIIADMTEFLQTWGTHPNNAYVDGRPVIFAYRIEKSPQECSNILKALADKGLKAYWLIQPQRETTLWEDTLLITDYLKVFDGLYDFGVNGFTQADATQRLQNGKKALTEAGKPEGILCAGITQGYAGPHNAFYRPFHGFDSFLINWQAARTTNAQWVCLTTWNDYGETTHFEPSIWGSDVMLQLNQEQLRTWRHTPLIPRPPQVYASYQQECRLGDEWDLSLASLPYTTAPATVTVRLTDIHGKTVHESNPILLPNDKELIHRFHFTDLGLQTPLRLRVYINVQTQKVPNKADNWVQLYPLTIRPGQMLSMRTLRFNLHDISEGTATISLKKSPQNLPLNLTATFPAWAWSGKAELFQNGQFIAREPIAKFGGPNTRISFDLKHVIPQYPRDLYIIKFTRDDGQILWSDPMPIDGSVVNLQQQVSYPVLLRHMTFDQAWMGIVTGYKIQHKPYEIIQQNLPMNEVFTIHLPMDHRNQNDDQLSEIGGWHWPILSGGEHRYGRVDTQAIPQWVEQTGPSNSIRQMLSFDGKDDRIALKARAMPHDVVTVETWIKPAETGHNMTLFSDQNGAMLLGLDELGKPYLTSNGKTIFAPDSITIEQWTHIAGSYDGNLVTLWVNGKIAAQTTNPNQSHGINSLGLIGALIREGRTLEKPFHGLMAGFALRALPANNHGFQLQNSNQRAAQ